MNCMVISTQCIIPPNYGGTFCEYSQIKCLEQGADKVCVVMGNCENDESVSSWFSKNTYVHKIQRTSKKMKGGFTERIRVLVDYILSGLPRQAHVVEGDRQKDYIMSMIQQLNIDCVILMRPYAAQYIDINELRKLGINVVLVEQNVEYMFIKYVYPKYGLLSKFEIMRTFKYEKNIVQAVNSVITLSPKDAELINSSFNCKKAKYLPTLSIEKNIKWMNKESDYVVYSGALNFFPNYEGMKWFLDNVWKIYVNRNSRLRLKITGKISERIKNEFSRYPNVEFTGYLSEQELRDVFLSCLFTVVPVFKGSGIKIKLLESLSYGVPTLASEHCFEGVPYKKGKGIMEPYFFGVDANDFIDKIQMLHMNKKLRIKMSEQAMKFYNENYASKKNIENWLECIMNKNKITAV